MSLSVRCRNASIRTKYLLAVSTLLPCLFLCGLYVFMELVPRILFQRHRQERGIPLRKAVGS